MASKDFFRVQYESDAHARYYAHKREATTAGRMSNYLERSMIRCALRRMRRKARFQSVLDLPSGAGRFLPVLAEFNVSVTAMDTSAAMLQEGRRYAKSFHRSYVAIVGSAFNVPLADDAVDLVLCARLLHHFPDARQRIDILTELARVARYGIIISFFDATSYYAWRRRRRNLRRGKASKRYSIPREQCRREGEAAGLELLGFTTSLRYCTEITGAAFLVHK